MAAPIWFDEKAYLSNKAAQLNTIKYDGKSDWTAADVTAAFGSMTAYEHFLASGNAENISPNTGFDVAEYLAAKAAQLNDAKFEGRTDWDEASVLASFNKAGISAWDHYVKYGTTEGINPSNGFDTSAYLEAKAAQLNAMNDGAGYEGRTDWTAAQVAESFQQAGISALEHYYLAGQSEGLTIPAVPAGEQVTTDFNPYEDSGNDPEKPGETYELTEGWDNVTGTANDDTFNAELGALNAQDRIDGGDGNDTLHAYVADSLLGGGNYAVNPRIENVENLFFTAQGSTTDGGGDNLTGAAIDFDRVQLADGKTMTIGSVDSRGDLSIEDVRHNSNKTVIRFQDADPGVGLEVYFRPQNIAAENPNTDSVMHIQLMDVRGAQEDGQPLKENPFDTFTFQYTDNSDVVRNVTLKLGRVSGDASYDDLVAAFNDALAASGYGDVISASLGTAFRSEASLDGVHYSSDLGYTVKLECSSGSITTRDENGVQLEGTGWGVSSGTMPDMGGITWGISANSATDCPLTSTTLELSGAGHVDFSDNAQCLPNLIQGSSAGDVIIGSTANANGVERIDVKMDEGSWLSALASTNEALRMVTVEGRDIDGDGKAENGSLFIGDWNGRGSLKGDGSASTWTDAASLLSSGANAGNVAGLVDVAVFDGASYAGDINVAASITSHSYDKYLKGVDGDESGLGNPPVDGYDGFAYNTGAGDDVINMTVSGAVAADNDFKLNINTGAGNDLVAFRYDDAITGNQGTSQKGLQNVTISTGEGDDTVWFYGGAKGTGGADSDGSAVISAGAGNDVIYVNQQEFFTGEDQRQLDSSAYNAVWVLNTTGTQVGIAGLEGATMNNDLSSGQSQFNVNVPQGSTLQVTVSFKGFEATVDVDGVNGTTVSADAVNQAIIRAVENDPVLGNLLSAKDGAGNSLIIESLINGQMTPGDLEISFGVRDADGKVTPGGITANNRYDPQFATDSSSNPFQGNNSTDTQAVVDGGAGNDLIVIGPNGERDVVVLGGGDDVLVGFKSGEDKLNVAGLLNAITEKEPFAQAGTVTTLTNNSAAITDFSKTLPDDKNEDGIYSQTEINTFLSEGTLKLGFTGAESGDKAVVLLHNQNAAGQHVYTILQVTPNGSDVSATVIGSLTLGAGESLDIRDLVVSNDLGAVDSGAGLPGITVTPGTDGKVPGVDSGATVSGTENNDTFDALSSDLKAQDGTQITKIEGGAGNDTFNVKGDMGSIVIDGGAGSDEVVMGKAGGTVTVAGVEKVDASAATNDVTVKHDGDNTLSSFTGGTGSDFAVADTANDATLEGGDGANMLMGGKLMFAGAASELRDGVYAESEAADLTGGKINAHVNTVFNGDSANWLGDAKKLFSDHNVLDAHGLDGADMVASSTMDTFLFQNGNISGKDREAPSAEATIHSFKVGEDSILLMGQGDMAKTVTSADSAFIGEISSAITVAKGNDNSEATITINWSELKTDVSAWNSQTLSDVAQTTIHLVGIQGWDGDTSDLADFFGTATQNA